MGEKLERIEKQFSCVEDLSKVLSDHINRQVADFYNLALRDPKRLVRVLRIIENDDYTQEQLQKQLDADIQKKESSLFEYSDEDSDQEP